MRRNIFDPFTIDNDSPAVRKTRNVVFSRPSQDLDLSFRVLASVATASTQYLPHRKTVRQAIDRLSDKRQKTSKQTMSEAVGRSQTQNASHPHDS